MHPSVYKRPLLLVLAVWMVGLVLFYTPVPSKRDVFHALPLPEVELTGRVENFAVTKKDRQNVRLKVFSVNGTPAKGWVYARVSGFNPQWKDTLRLRGRLQLPYRVHLPGNFDWRDYLKLKHIFTEIKTADVSVVKQAAWPWRLIRRVRQDILQVLQDSFPPPLAQVASGIMLGEKGEFPDDLYTAFQNSGAIHLLVASGGNVGFVTLLTLSVGVLFGWRRKPLLAVALVTAGIYTLAAGADAPLVRAYLMAASACVGYFLGRNSGVFQGFLLSCLCILLFNPAALFETGFQMSFLATLAIILCLNNYRVPSSWPSYLRFFAQIFLATLAAQLVLLPIFTNVFYKVSLTGLVSNMLLVPLASFLMGLGFAYYLLSVLHAGILLYYPCLWGLEGFQWLVQFFASFRFSSLAVTAWNPGSIIAYYIGLFWVSQWPHKAFARRLLIPCLLLAAGAIGTGMWLENRPRVYLLSEWNHSAALVRMKKGNFLLFNNGMSPEKLQRVLFSLGVTKAKFATNFGKEDDAFSSLATQVKTPFEDLWPGDEILLDGGVLRAKWALHLTKEGREWEDTGYSGQPSNDLSYCIEKNKKEICIGSHARFVRLPGGEVVDGILNDTKEVSW